MGNSASAVRGDGDISDPSPYASKKSKKKSKQKASSRKQQTIQNDELNEEQEDNQRQPTGPTKKARGPRESETIDEEDDNNNEEDDDAKSLTSTTRQKIKKNLKRRSLTDENDEDNELNKEEEEDDESFATPSSSPPSKKSYMKDLKKKIAQEEEEEEQNDGQDQDDQDQDNQDQDNQDQDNQDQDEAVINPSNETGIEEEILDDPSAEDSDSKGVVIEAPQEPNSNLANSEVSIPQPFKASDRLKRTPPPSRMKNRKPHNSPSSPISYTRAILNSPGENRAVILYDQDRNHRQMVCTCPRNIPPPSPIGIPQMPSTLQITRGRPGEILLNFNQDQNYGYHPYYGYQPPYMNYGPYTNFWPPRPVYYPCQH